MGFSSQLPPSSHDDAAKAAYARGPWYSDYRLTPEQRATKGTYIPLGDSYSSGENGSEYEPGTDDDNQWKKWWQQHGHWPGEVHQNMCHRSTKAYPQRVNADFDFQDYTFRACSGAVIDDFYKPNNEVHDTDHPNRQNEGEAPQLDHLDENTSLVTFSVGGNDAGFADVLTECVAATADTLLNDTNVSPAYGISVPPTTCNGSKKAQDAEARIPDTERRLRQLLKDARERAPNARIVVLGYPKFFPPEPALTSSMVQPADQRWINAKVEELNDAVHRAVTDAGGPTAGFEFVDTRNAFAGCEIGTKESCMAGLRVGVRGNFDKGRPISHGSFHPNDEGHRRIADLVAEQIRNGE